MRWERSQVYSLLQARHYLIGPGTVSVKTVFMSTNPFPIQGGSSALSLSFHTHTSSTHAQCVKVKQLPRQRMRFLLFHFADKAHYTMFQISIRTTVTHKTLSLYPISGHSPDIVICNTSNSNQLSYFVYPSLMFSSCHILYPSNHFITTTTV